MPYNFAAESLHIKKLQHTFFKRRIEVSSTFQLKNAEKGHLWFSSPPLGGPGATYAVHLRLIGKIIVDFLLVIKIFVR